MPFHGYQPGKKRANWPIVLVLLIALVGVAAAAILTSQTGNLGFHVSSPNLGLSTSQLQFGSVSENSVTVLPLRITNTGNEDLILSYSFQITGNPSWAIIHINSPTAFNQGGTDLNGYALAQGQFIDTIVALEIMLGPVPGDYMGTIMVSGSTPA